MLTTIEQNAAEIRRLYVLAQKTEEVALAAHKAGNRLVEVGAERMQDDALRSIREISEHLSCGEAQNGREMLAQLLVLRDQVDDAIGDDRRYSAEADQVRITFGQVIRAVERATGERAVDVLPYFTVPE